MSTAKKVAKESVSKKPVRATVKRPKKTIDQADLAPLSLRKKSVVSVEKPQVQKKALPAAKAATKPQSKTKKTTESLIFEVKKPSLSELSAQKMTRSTSKPAVVVETEQQERIQLIQALGANLVEQALSLKTEQVMTNVSRTAGLVLASVGIMFALFSLPTVIGQTSQLAAIGEFDVATSALPISINCDDPLLYTSIPCADEVDQKPDAAFVIGSAPDVLKERVPVTVTVEHAQSVRLFAYNKTAGTHHPLGLMTRVTESTWSLDWDTAKYNDGDYKVRVLVGNFYGTYEEVHSGTVTVLNHPLTEQAPVESLDDTVSTDDSESVASLTPITISSPTKESLGEFEFIVKVSNADKVKLYATHLETSQSSLIGYAIAVDDTTWRIRWVSGTSALGVYRVRAQVIEDGESTVGGDILVKKVAALTDSSYQEITLTPETDLEAVNETGSDAVITEPVIKPVLRPDVKLSILAPQPLAGEVGLNIQVANASSVQLYVQGQNSLLKKYLGHARVAYLNTWVYRLNTTQVPDGEYSVIAVVQNQFGTYESRLDSVKVRNQVVASYTTQEAEKIAVIAALAPAATSPVATDNTPDSVTSEPSPIKSIQVVTGDVIERELVLLAAALRMQDTAAAAVIRERIENLKRQAVQRAGTTLAVSEQTELDAFVQSSIDRITRDVEIVNKLIVERTKEKANEDTDQDGVSNYDEVVIYKTNPFVADTDNDGFLDGVEILSGYDPLEVKPEVLVAYESPQESGIVREDILSVTSIITEVPNEVPVADAPRLPVALISGTAPAHSFVTLYIFSTPIVVTIKTDEDGSWSYRFDKELEDGEHEVFVGVTDNAGKIVAKSNPFSFVKEAQAFTAATAEAATAPVQPLSTDGELLSDYTVYLVLGVSTVAIGLVLMLLGLKLDAHRRRDDIVVTEGESVV